MSHRLKFECCCLVFLFLVFTAHYYQKACHLLPLVSVASFSDHPIYGSLLQCFICLPGQAEGFFDFQEYLRTNQSTARGTNIIIFSP